MKRYILIIGLLCVMAVLVKDNYKLNIEITNLKEDLKEHKFATEVCDSHLERVIK